MIKALDKSNKLHDLVAIIFGIGICKVADPNSLYDSKWLKLKDVEIKYILESE